MSVDPRPGARVSIVVEWANTVLNGVPRAQMLLDILRVQWEKLAAREYPADLPAEATGYLDTLDRRAEVLVVSGHRVSADDEKDIRRRVPDCFDLSVHVGEGLEYYALKNFGADLAGGDILLFLDSDVHPEPGWLAHLLGALARPEIHAVLGQPYVAPTGVFAAAFALGWTYQLRDEVGRLERCKKVYANNIAFRADTFRAVRFPSLDRRTRGASSILSRQLDSAGHPIWINTRARVDHPPPSGYRHLAVRALAHGRDTYMMTSEDRRTLRGLVASQARPVGRLARGLGRTARHWRRVGLRPWQVPAAIAIFGAYYALFSLGGLLTHASPAFMGRHFRV